MKKKNNKNPFLKINLKKWKPFMAFIFVAAFLSISWSASDQYIEVKTIPLKKFLNTSLDWHVTAYNIKEGEGTTFTTTNTPAKICFWNDIRRKEDLCSTAEEGPSAFPQVKELSLVELEKDREPKFGILFVSTRYGAVEPLHLISIWAYNHKETRFENILTPLRLNTQGEYKFTRLTSRRQKLIFVTANRIWMGGGEALYGPHKFVISIYDLTESGVFKIVEKYITERRYPSLEDVRDIDVISHELKKIEDYLPVKK
jgi:hypothetical protein